MAKETAVFIKSYAKQIGANVDDALSCLENSYVLLRSNKDFKNSHSSESYQQKKLINKNDGEKKDDSFNRSDL